MALEQIIHNIHHQVYTMERVLLTTTGKKHNWRDHRACKGLFSCSDKKFGMIQ